MSGSPHDSDSDFGSPASCTSQIAFNSDSDSDSQYTSLGCEVSCFVGHAQHSGLNTTSARPAAATAPYSSARLSSSTPDTANLVLVLSLLQDVNGSWRLDDSLAKAVRLPKASITAAQPADTSCEAAASAWATAVAIAFLLKKCAEKRAAFSLLEKKARKWMAKQDGVSSEKVSELTSCADHLF